MNEMYAPYYPYPSYANYGYQAQMQQRGQMAMQNQQQPRPQQPPIQYDAPIQDVRFVTSEEAKAFIVMPNSKALLIDKGNGIAHLKMADNMGQSVTHCFKFQQINPDGSPIAPKETPQPLDADKFAKREDLEGFVSIQQYEELASKLKELSEQFSSMKKTIAGGKPYVAGSPSKGS